MRVLFLGEKQVIWPTDRLTRFEVARLIGSRALQISLGAPVLTKTEELDPKKVAKIEFKQKIIPITIKRKLPSLHEVVINVKKGIENWLDMFGEI